LVVAMDDPGSVAAALRRMLEPGRRAELLASVERTRATVTWENERSGLLDAYEVVPDG